MDTPRSHNDTERFWQNRTVAVTGAGGFIGSHLAERLVAKGARVRAFVHYNALGTYGWLDNSSVADRMSIVPGDVTDEDSLRPLIDGADTVFHLAALISIPYSYSAPRSYVNTNVIGTMNVLQVARQCGVRRIVHTSTSEVYGTAQRVPISEEHPLQGQSPYSASKIGADKLAESFYRSFDTPVVTVRPFNTYGPRQSGRAIVPTIITQILSGDKIKLGNLTPTRDLNFVSDTVDGFVAAAESAIACGEVVNLGSGREISIGDLVALIGNITGRPVHLEAEGARTRPPASEVERLLADNAKAQRILGWSPSVPLEKGLELTAEWIGRNLISYRPGVYVV